HRHGAVTALVGAYDDGLPPAARLLLDSVQGQPLLGANGAESCTQQLGVLRRHPLAPGSLCAALTRLCYLAAYAWTTGGRCPGLGTIGDRCVGIYPRTPRGVVTDSDGKGVGAQGQA